MMTEEQKILHERLRTEQTKRWHNQEMIDYCVNDCEYVVPLENGGILEINKPRIETRFCFGYGYCGMSTEEEEKNASDAARDAKEHSDYFLSENLDRSNIDRDLKLLKEGRLEAYETPRVAVMKKDPNSNIWYYFFKSEYDISHDDDAKDIVHLTDKDKFELQRGLETVRNSFLKRLNTYLKKYGTSKLRTWTYLSD
jgi:hypothetical protein